MSSSYYPRAVARLNFAPSRSFFSMEQQLVSAAPRTSSSSSSSSSVGSSSILLAGQRNHNRHTSSWIGQRKNMMLFPKISGCSSSSSASSVKMKHVRSKSSHASRRNLGATRARTLLSARGTSTILVEPEQATAASVSQSEDIKMNSTNTLPLGGTEKKVLQHDATALPLGGSSSSSSSSPAESKKTMISPDLWMDLMILSKAKLSLLCAISAMPGYLLSAGPAFHIGGLITLCGGTFLSAASSQAWNQIIERKYDEQMVRTMNRPLAIRKSMSVQAASLFAATSGLSGLALLGLEHNALTASVAAATILGYVGVYTPMKRITPYNTHIGAVVGSLPVVIGFTAGMSPEQSVFNFIDGSYAWSSCALYLFGFQALWQMPHFYALAFLHRHDYKNAGYKMFCTDDDPAVLGKYCNRWLLPMLLYPALSYAWLGPYASLGFVSMSSGMVFVWWRTCRDLMLSGGTGELQKIQAFKFFKVSLPILPAFLALFYAFHCVKGKTSPWTDSAKEYCVVKHE